MEAKEALKVLRAQYHDFLNCLQVVSGLVDLGRPEKIKEYVRRAADEFTARGRLAKSGLPEVTWLLLRFQTEAVEHGIKVSCELGQGSGESVPEAAFLGRFHEAIVAHSSGVCKERLLKITGKRVPEGYALTYSGPFAWKEVAGAVAETAAAAGVKLTVAAENAATVLLPVR
jgi:hypothetical protein